MEVGTPSAAASALVPPSLSTMSEEVMAPILAENASISQESIALLVNARCCGLRQKGRVLGSKDILDELARRGIEKTEIADALGIHPSQVTRLYATDKKPRQLKHDEAVKLVAKYRLEQAPQAKVLPPAVWRLVAHHAASTFGLSLEEDDPLVRAVSADLAAFSRFFRNPRVQGTIEAAQNFFDAIESHREPAPGDPPKTDPQPAR